MIKSNGNEEKHYGSGFIEKRTEPAFPGLIDAVVFQTRLIPSFNANQQRRGKRRIG